MGERGIFLIDNLSRVSLISLIFINFFFWEKTVKLSINLILTQCSHLVPGHGARARYSLNSNVNTSIFQLPTLEFGHGAGARVQGPNPCAHNFCIVSSGQ